MVLARIKSQHGHEALFNMALFRCLSLLVWKNRRGRGFILLRVICFPVLSHVLPSCLMQVGKPLFKEQGFVVLLIAVIGVNFSLSHIFVCIGTCWLRNMLTGGISSDWKTICWLIIWSLWLRLQWLLLYFSGRMHCHLSLQSLLLRLLLLRCTSCYLIGVITQYSHICIRISSCRIIGHPIW